MTIVTGKVTVLHSAPGEYATKIVSIPGTTTGGVAVLTLAELDNLTDTRGQSDFLAVCTADTVTIMSEEKGLHEDTDVFYIVDTDGTGIDFSSIALTGTETFSITHDAMTENLKPFSVGATVTDLTHGARQGAISIDLDREATSALSGWDGNPDCALKIQAKNRAVSGANGGTRGIDVNARCRDSGTESWINAIYATAENDGAGIANSSCAEFNTKSTAAISGDQVGVRIHDQSTVPVTGDHYGLKFTAQYNITREHAIHVGSTLGTWTNALTFDGNVTNVLDFIATDGTNGYTIGTFTNNVVAANPDGFVQIDGNGTPYYVPAYATLPA